MEEGGRGGTRLPRESELKVSDHAADDATAGAARGVRASSQNESSTTGPIPTAKTSVPIPTVPPSRKPTTSTAISSPVRGGSEPDAEPQRGDEHQRVARAGAERGADVERRPDAEAGEREADQRDSDAERLLRESVDPVEPGQRDHEGADENRVQKRPEPDPGAQPPDEHEHDHGDEQVGGSEGDAELLGKALVEHVPGRQAELGLEEEDDPARAEEEPRHEPGDPRGEAAVEGRWREHAPERSCEAAPSGRGWWRCRRRPAASRSGRWRPGAPPPAC